MTADPSETGPTPLTGVVSPGVRSALIGMAGALSVTAVWVGSLAYGPYQITYGRHGWGQAEMVFLLHYVLFGLPGILLVTAGLTGAARGRLVALFERLPRLSVADGRALALGATALVFLAVTATRMGLLRDTAVTDDENVYAFMAKVLASGRLSVPSLPETIRPFFDNQFMINNGKWYGIYFPGYPAVLAAGEWLHVTRWVPAVAAALTVPIAFAATRRVFGQRAAVLVLPLMLLSPFFVFSSATFLAHSTAGLLVMAFVYAALRVSERPGAAGWWLA
ncbi:MAG: glycosyltransferase family 39 protein, partial [Candidatus Rokubacteria bacterium]|nr:glycosyltransferase family 39 protein [Candidatus Rokubacteria bacterium]